MVGRRGSLDGLGQCGLGREEQGKGEEPLSCKQKGGWLAGVPGAVFDRAGTSTGRSLQLRLALPSALYLIEDIGYCQECTLL